ncbi:rCG28220, isoform CRA_a [Rattus norvegicus]|uniref:RCG28220, isoform CRA_a n=1 Tax=Rattus norvegicus TaxID=10116 RepID=A6IDU7_RAT|nr:rCG28220, isoform CRA_a [Rattus norvegicus]EDM15034.1 rCG28220, isoform CRA_a [Rattus norvegicus]
MGKTPNRQTCYHKFSLTSLEILLKINHFYLFIINKSTEYFSLESRAYFIIHKTMKFQIQSTDIYYSF